MTALSQVAPIPGAAPFGLNAADAIAAGPGKRRQWLRGDLIYTPSDLADSLYWVEQGRINLTSTTQDGRELLIDRVGRGGFFGEVAALLGVCHFEFATAAEDSTVHELKSRDLEALLLRSPRMSLDMCRRVGDRLRVVQGRLVSLLFRRVELRVRTTLSDMVGSAAGRDNASPTLSLTHQDLANLIGASRQETSRALKHLENDGIIALGYGAIVVKSPSHLREGVA